MPTPAVDLKSLNVSSIALDVRQILLPYRLFSSSIEYGAGASLIFTSVLVVIAPDIALYDLR